MRYLSSITLLGVLATSMASGQVPASRALNAKYANLPLAFEVNVGQAAKPVNFVSRGRGYGLLLSPNEATFSLSRSFPQKGKNCLPRSASSTLRMRLLGANANPQARGEEKLPGVAHYFKGNNPKQWRTNIGTYSKVRYKSVYKGIDQVFYGNQRQLEYDFVVSPFTSYQQIKMEFTGAKSLKLLQNGDLCLNMEGGSLTWKAPVIYQEASGKRVKVGGKYVLQGRNRVGFEVAQYDHSKPLVIDPILLYSTYMGGTPAGGGLGSENVNAYDLCINGAGEAYITGYTSNLITITGNALDGSYNGGGDVFVSKLNAAGTALLYSTYLGGDAGDQSQAITLDNQGSIYLVGQTESTNYPTTPGAFDRTHNGGSARSFTDVFVTKLNAAGSAIVYSTYLGGEGYDIGQGIAVDSSRNAVVVGMSISGFFPITLGGPAVGEMGFVTRLNANGTGLVFSRFLGGNSLIGVHSASQDVALDSNGNAYVVGSTQSSGYPNTAGAYDRTFNGGLRDAVVTKVNPAGGIVFSTYLGGSGDDLANGVAVDSNGNSYITGQTTSTNFPTTVGAIDTTHNGGYDVFVTKLNAAGSALGYSTFLGGDSDDIAEDIALNSHGIAYVTGSSRSPNFPLTPDAVDTSMDGEEVFVTQWNTTGFLLFSTFLGGNGNNHGYGIVVDALGNAYITGQTSAFNFPTTTGAFDTVYDNSGNDSFVAKLGLTRIPILLVPTIDAPYESNPVITAQLLKPDSTPYVDKALTFTLDGAVIKTAKTNASGFVTFNYNLGNRPKGNYPLVVHFGGDAFFQSKTVNSLLRVLASNVSLTLGAGILSANYRLGVPMTPQISVTMRRTSDNQLLPNETLAFKLNNVDIGTAVTNANGVAVLPYIPPTSVGVGSRTLKATYAATTNYKGQVASWSLTFIKTPTALATTAITGDRGTNVNLIATLTNKDTNALLEGKTVKFFVGGVLAGQSNTNASGVATLPYTLPNTAGKAYLVVVFDGNDFYANSSRQTTITTR